MGRSWPVTITESHTKGLIPVTDWLLNLRIEQFSFLATVSALSVAGAVYLLVRKPTKRWLITSAIALLGGGALGLLASWFAGDVLDLFGVALTAGQRAWVALTFAAIALAVVNLWRSRWWRKVVAIVSVPLLLLTGAAFVNSSIGYYSTVSDALGINPYHDGTLGYETGELTRGPVAQDWRPPADLPATGKVVSMTIPGTVSHFAARAAVIYLPPAALVPDPPVLPVLIMMSGQPGSPSDQFTAGHINDYMDAYAAAHHGLAPIVVSPDQLGPSEGNPMCVDSPLGNSATYVTTDVVNWISAHFRVTRDRSAWAVGGFSQGATCAMQFMSGYPKMFGSVLAISSEIGPTIGPDTVEEGFGGSQAAYNAAMPISLMKKNGPFTDTVASFAVGEDDTQYKQWAYQLSAAAQRAGMHTALYISPGTAHDWYTVAYGIKMGFPRIGAHMGLG